MEEEPDGWFFDGTLAENDSDAEGDPFANGYLTEDEIEFPEDYKPAPYLPGRIVDQIYFLHSVRGYTVKDLCTKYRISAERVSAILNLKKTEPSMIAQGLYDTRLDDLLTQLYEDKFREPKDGRDLSQNGAGDLDLGVNYDVLRDEEEPDNVAPPGRREVGNVFRLRFALATIKPPPKKDRLHDSKFAFKDISGRSKKHLYHAHRVLVVSDWNGDLRKATNVEALFRSWELRTIAPEDAHGEFKLPFPVEDAHKPHSFRLVP